MVSPLSTPSVAPSLGNYSQAVTVDGPGRWVFMSGQVGVDANGELQQGFEAQAHQVWRNIAGVLHDAGMTLADLVKTTAYVTEAEHLPTHRAIRNEHVGAARPAGTLLVVSRPGPPDALIEVEAVAFRAAPAAAGSTTPG